MFCGDCFFFGFGFLIETLFIRGASRIHQTLNIAPCASRINQKPKALGFVMLGFWLLVSHRNSLGASRINQTPKPSTIGVWFTVDAPQ